ncbi:MAG TPA: murein biosynthesis integral membrane protein MurJ [Pseudonocardiaceae bacterium]|nr:murein biosynthesis integral membrane protein MurJ [Pseudonocardiaceae bacterium]
MTERLGRVPPPPNGGRRMPPPGHQPQGQPQRRQPQRHPGRPLPPPLPPQGDRWYPEPVTELIPIVPPTPDTPSLAQASGSMVIATAVSRITGFVRQVLLVGVVGFGAVNDSYNVANNLPNIVYELLLGGVLAGVVIPTLVRAQHEDPDEGLAFTQRLLTVSFVVLAVGTTIAVLCAPLLTKLYFSSNGVDVPALTTAFSRLILPEIMFYGIFGMLSGILNSRHNFKPAAWAPVLNNVIMFGTLGIYALLPGEITLNPIKMTEPKLLVLGIGTTLGVVVQALMLIRPLLRIGFSFRWRWGFDRRLGQFGQLALWLVLYTLVSQVGYVELTKVATSAATGTYTTYTNSWLLLQVPYGILGVSMLTAIMPRLSRAAAEGDMGGIIDNLSTGSRMAAVMLVPLCAMITVLGPQVGEALFAIRHSQASSATVLGLSLTTSAFGLWFFAITMLQMRVFYAMNDARTPTLINAIMVVIKVALFYTCSHVLDSHHVVYGLTFVNAFGFVVNAVIGESLLRRRIGALDTGRVIRTLLKVGVASAWGAGAALLVADGIEKLLPGASGLAESWLTMIVGGLVGLAITFGLMMLLRVSEIKPVTRRLLRLAGRR